MHRDWTFSLQTHRNPNILAGSSQHVRIPFSPPSHDPKCSEGSDTYFLFQIDQTSILSVQPACFLERKVALSTPISKFTARKTFVWLMLLSSLFRYVATWQALYTQWLKKHRILSKRSMLKSTSFTCIFRSVPVSHFTLIVFLEIDINLNIILSTNPNLSKQETVLLSFHQFKHEML